MIAFSLLGQFGIKRDGQPLELASRPAQSLLAYLLLNAGIESRREKLAGVIWPEATEDNARTYLRQALWRIRKAVGADYLMADRLTVAFNTSSDYQLDVSILERPLEEGWSTSSLGKALDVYKGELLPGFYDDWIVLERDRLQNVFEQRIRKLLNRLSEQGHWQELLHWGERWIAMGHAAEPAYRALMIAHAELGDLARMASTYERCVAALAADLGVEPSTETVQLNKQLQEGGHEAVKVSAGLYGRPLAEISINDSRRDSLPPYQPAFLDTASPEFVDSAESFEGAYERAFIRREDELTALEHYFEQAVGGHGQVIFVTGEVGQGKTTLLNEFSKRVQLANTDVIVASGACCLINTPVSAPYDIFRELLEMLTADVEPAWLAKTINREQAVNNWMSLPTTIDILIHYGPNLIGTLIPAEPLLRRARSAAIGQDRLDRLYSLLEGKDRPDHHLSEQGDLFAEVANFLVALAESRPLLLILDDLHWIDPSSIGLLSHFGHRVQESAILLLGAFRPEEISLGTETISSRYIGETSPHPLAMVLAEYKRRFGNIFLSLDETSSHSGQAFIDSLLDSQPNKLDKAFRSALTRHTDGNPLFTVELLREMRAQGLLRQDNLGRWDISPNLTWNILPPRVEGVIETRINRLDPELRKWLEVASVEGDTFTAEVIAKIQGSDEHSVVKRLSSELDRGHHLIKAEGVSRTRTRRISSYKFQHHLFQRYLYAQMDEVERTHLHELVGEALETLYGDQTTAIADQLAMHFTEAWIPEKAISYWLQAGERAVQVAAYEEAFDYLIQGLEMLDTMPTNSEMLRLELAFRVALGTPLIALKGWAAAEVGENYSRAFDLCEQIGVTPERFLVIWNLWRFHSTQGELNRAAQLAKQVMAQAEDEQDDSLLLQAHHAYWTSDFYAGNLLDAQYNCDQGLAKYDQQQHRAHAFIYGGHDPGVCGRCYLAFTLWYLGYPEQALSQIKEAIHLASVLSHTYSLAYALSFAADIYLFRRDIKAAHKQAGQALDFSREHGFSSWIAWAMIRRGWALVQQGETTQGITSMQQGLEMSQTEKQVIFQPYQLALLAEAYQKVGNVDAALTSLDAALDAINLTGERHYEAEVYRLKGELHLVQGSSLTVAEDLFQKALVVARQQNARSWELRTSLSLARLWRDQGKLGEAHKALSSVFDWFKEGHDTRDLVDARMLLDDLS